MRNAKTAPDGWIPFLRTLAGNSKLKFVINEKAPAATDGKTMWLPALPANLTKGDLVLFKGNALHEVGHLRYSNIDHFQAFSKAHGAFAQFVLNALDDVFMEGRMAGWKVMAARYLRESTELLVERQQFRDGSKDLAEAVGCYCITYLTAKRWPSLAKANVLVEANLRMHLGEHADKMVALLSDLLDVEFPAVKSTNDCSVLTLKVIELFKSEAEKEDQSKQPNGGEGDDDKAKDDDGDQTEGQSKTDKDSEPKGDDGDGKNGGADSTDKGEEGKENGDGQSGTSSKPDAGSEGSEKSGEPNGSQGKEEPEEKGNGEVAGKSLKELVDEMLNSKPEAGEVFDKEKAVKELAAGIKAGCNPDYKKAEIVAELMIDGAGETTGFVDGMPIVEANRSIADLLTEKVGRNSGTMANRLLALLANREEADPYSTSNGALSDRNLYRFALDDNRVFAKCDDIELPTAAVTITADLSGSTLHMSNGSTVAEEIQVALTIIEKVLHQVGTPREILGFAPNTGEISCMVKSFQDNSRTALDRIGGLMKLAGGSSTPIGTAVMQAGARLFCQEAQRKLLLVLTDGVPDSIENATNMTNTVLNQGVEVIYLVIGSPRNCDWLKKAGFNYTNALSGKEILPALISKVGEFLY